MGEILECLACMIIGGLFGIFVIALLYISNDDK